jgi:competence protein ComGC
MNAMNYSQRSVAALVAALVMFAGCQKKQEAPPVPGATLSKSSIVSAEKNSFAEVTAKLDPGGNFYLYLSTEQVLGSFSNRLDAASNLISALPNMPGTGRQTLDKVFAVLGRVVRDSGLSPISGLGMSSIAREKGFYYNKVVVHHYPGQNAGLIWSLFGQSPHRLNQLDLLPQNTALAASADFDLPLAWTNILQAAKLLDMPEAGPALDQFPAKFHDWTGLDLDAALKSLGGEYGVILTLDTNKNITLPLGGEPMMTPNPGLCLVFKVRSDLIFDRVDKLLDSNPILGRMVVKTDEPGLKMRTAPLPIPFPVELHPTLARVGDYLLLATSDSMVREMVAVQAGKTNGFKSTETFKKLSQGVPGEGNNFSIVTSALAGTLRQIQERTMAGKNMDPQALKSYHELLQAGGNLGSYTVGRNSPDGWEGVGNGGSQGAQMMVLPAVAVAGVLAAIAIPNFVKARASAQENKCASNLRLMDGAKRLWALEHKKQNTDTPTMEDLMPYLAAALNDKAPVCPAGGVYTIGSVGQNPTCSVPGHVLP